MPQRSDEQLVLVQAIGAAAASRVPLDATLAALAEEQLEPGLADVASQLADRLGQGVPLEQAAAELGGKLPRELSALLSAGIESGDVAGALERFAQQRLASQRVVRRLREALAYPLVVLAILVPLMLFLSLYLIPVFGDTFRDFDLDLPPITLLVLQISSQLPALLGGMALVAIAIPLLLRVIGGRWLLHRMRAALPVLGRFWTWSGQREFAALLAAMLDLRLPLTSAVRYAGQIVADRNIAAACPRVAARLESGESLGSSLAHSIHFDRVLAGLAHWGERHQSLVEALQIAADLFEDRIEQQAALIRRLLPPVTLVAVGTIIFFVIAGLMLPLIRLIEALA